MFVHGCEAKFIRGDKIYRIHTRIESKKGYYEKWKCLIFEGLRTLAYSYNKGDHEERKLCQRISFDRLYKFAKLFWYKNFTNLFGKHLILAQQLQIQLDIHVQLGEIKFYFKDGQTVYWKSDLLKFDRRIMLGRIKENIHIGNIINKILIELSRVRVRVCGVLTSEFKYGSIVNFKEATQGFTLEDIQNYIQFSHIIHFPTNCSYDDKKKFEVLNDKLKNELITQVSIGQILVSIDVGPPISVRYRCRDSELLILSTNKNSVDETTGDMDLFRIPEGLSITNKNPNVNSSKEMDEGDNDIDEIWNSFSSTCTPQPTQVIPEIPQNNIFFLKEFYIQENCEKNKVKILIQIKSILEMKQAYIFCKNIKTSKWLETQLRWYGMNCACMDENSLEISSFQNSGLVRVLFLTDESSHSSPYLLKRVPFLINYDFPESLELYVQRRRFVGYSSDTLVGKETSNLMIISFVCCTNISSLHSVCQQTNIQEMKF